MHKVFTKILLCGILPALSRHISRASELGIFENHYCLGCLSRDIPVLLLDLNDFEILSQTLPMLTGQSLFQNLSTRMVESVLLGMVWDLSMQYVFLFVFDFWKRLIVHSQSKFASYVWVSDTKGCLLVVLLNGTTLQRWLHPHWRKFQSRSTWDIQLGVWWIRLLVLLLASSQLELCIHPCIKIQQMYFVFNTGSHPTLPPFAIAISLAYGMDCQRGDRLVESA